jgi:Uma2 family endonuclease
MSTVSRSRAPEPRPDESDPFRYGWRYVRVRGPDGTESFDQIPLTLEDVLFPETGDFIVQTDPHDNDVNYLKDVFKSRLADNPRTAVVSDCRVDWNLTDVRPLGPDIAAFSNLRRHRPWRTLDVAAEGVRPLLVVEVTSPETRVNDVDTKVDYYHRARVPLYVIVDAIVDDGQERRLRLIGYRYTRAGYRLIEPDARGWLWLGPVRVWLGITQERRLGYDRVACYDPETDEELGDYTAVVQALALEKAARTAAETRAVEEAKAREQAEQQAAAEVARAAADAARAATATKARKQAERRAAAETKARKQAERRAAAETKARTRAEARARAEAVARAQAEARIRELEARVRRLKPGP